MANVRSLLPKVDELDVIAQLNSVHVISITETWLTNAVPDRAVNIPNFMLMRKDRSHCSKSIGGGICAYVHHSIPAERLTNFESRDFVDPSKTISPSTPYLNYSTRRNLSPPVG